MEDTSLEKNQMELYFKELSCPDENEALMASRASPKTEEGTSISVPRSILFVLFYVLLFFFHGNTLSRAGGGVKHTLRYYLFNENTL